MKTLRKLKPSFIAVLAAAAIALLLLAGLQYSWVGQISAGERERMQANLQIGAQRFSEDFDRELARAYLSLQMDATTLRDHDWQRYAQRYDRWQTTAPYPGLVRDVYLVEVDQTGRLRLSQFDAHAHTFTAASWPYDFGQARQRITQAYTMGLHSDEGASNIQVVADDIPALLVEVSRTWLLSNEQDLGIDADLLFSNLVLPNSLGRCLRCRSESADTPVLAFTVVLLDQQYIQQVFIPALAERNFPIARGVDYNLAVMRPSATEPFVYRTDASLTAAQYAASDATVPLFNLRYSDLNRFLLDGSLSFSEPPAPDGTQRVAIGILGSSATDDLAEQTPSHWLLVLKHRAGSLDQAIANVRTRNLLLSFSTLLLLAGSIAMVLVSTRRAQRLAQQQLEFASAVSHELRTPLAVICAAGENLADGLIRDPQKAQQYGTVISNEGRRLTEMVDQVLVFARIQAGQQDYQFAPTDAAQVVAGALHSMQNQIQSSGCAINTLIADDLPLLHADELVLRRSLQNLISNAIKYGNGTITVQAQTAVAEHETETQLSVHNDGTGIAAIDLPHIFEPFYRGQNARAAQAHGSGLGLSLVQHVLAAHGGRVSVTSALGQGTRFTLHLPVVDPPAPLQQPAYAETKSHR